MCLPEDAGPLMTSSIVLRVPPASSALHHQKNHTTAPAAQLLTGGYERRPGLNGVGFDGD